MARAAAAEPPVERLLRVARVPERDERARQVHAGRYAACGERVRHDVVAGNAAARREAIADREDALVPALRDLRDVRRECRRASANPEPDDMNRLSSPLRRELDAGDEADARRVTRCAGLGAARYRVVVREREQRDAAGDGERDEIGG